MSLIKSWLSPNRQSGASTPGGQDATSSLRAHRAVLDVQSSPSPHDTALRLDSDLTTLDSKARELHRHLQRLLDAQAEGLSANVERDVDNQSSDLTKGSEYGLSPSRIIPVRQPPPMRVTLRAARRGIMNTMHQLAAIKTEEARLIEAKLQEERSSIDKITGWEKRRRGLLEEIANIQQSESGSRVDNLKKEGKTLEEEIQAMEIQLAELKSKRRAVYHELATLENSIQSKLSSYRASLALLDSQIADFLAIPSAITSSLTAGDTYLSLPSSRRTRDMALELAQTSEGTLHTKFEEADTERCALEKGIQVWKEVVDRVNVFERLLARFVRQLDQSANSADSAGLGENAEGSSNAAQLHMLTHSLDPIVADLETNLKLAESRGWNLLCCCIGAELEALLQGRQMLEALACPTGKPSPIIEGGTKEEYSAPSQILLIGHEDMSSTNSLLDSKRGGCAHTPSALEDDQPDPDFLISEQDGE